VNKDGNGWTAREALLRAVLKGAKTGGELVLLLLVPMVAVVTDRQLCISVSDADYCLGKNEHLAPITNNNPPQTCMIVPIVIRFNGDWRYCRRQGKGSSVGSSAP